jgi:hypothetical protein
MTANRVPLSVAIFLAASLSLIAQSQPDGTIPKTTEFKLGQVWTMKEGMNVTILAIEDVHKLGKVVHVRVDKIPWGNCGGYPLTQVVEHLAITEKMMRSSGLVLLKEKVDLPESSLSAYGFWKGQKKRDVIKEPLDIAILRRYLPAPIGICNLVPSQT